MQEYIRKYGEKKEEEALDRYAEEMKERGSDQDLNDSMPLDGAPAVEKAPAK